MAWIRQVQGAACGMWCQMRLKLVSVGCVAPSMARKDRCPALLDCADKRLCHQPYSVRMQYYSKCDRAGRRKTRFRCNRGLCSGLCISSLVNRTRWFVPAYNEQLHICIDCVCINSSSYLFLPLVHKNSQVYKQWTSHPKSIP